MVRAMTNESNPDSTGLIDVPCKCHFVVEDVKYRPDKEDVEVKSTVVACTDPAQVGKSHTEWFKLVGKAASKFFQMAIAVGALCDGKPYTKARWKADKEAGVDPEIDENSMVGGQWFGKVEMEEYEGKERPKVNFHIYHPLDEAVKDWPKDEETYSIFGAAVGSESGESNPSAQSQETVATGAGGGNGDKWGDL